MSLPNDLESEAKSSNGCPPRVQLVQGVSSDLQPIYSHNGEGDLFVGLPLGDLTGPPVEYKKLQIL